jgi:hypothetical protein
MIKVLHVSTGLGTGGAEMMLYKLVERMDPARFHNEVVSLMDAGSVGERIRALGVPVAWLGLRQTGIRRVIPNPLTIINLIRIVRKAVRM